MFSTIKKKFLFLKIFIPVKKKVTGTKYEINPND